MNTYLERVAVHDHEALEARLETDVVKYGEFKEQTKGIEQYSVKAVNLGREIGLSFEEYYLPTGEEHAEVYFMEHYAQRLKMSYAMFKWFIGIARRLEAPAKTMREVLPALQLALFAGELLEMPERAETQRAHLVEAPYSIFLHSLQNFQSGFEELLEKAESWDDLTKTKIKEELARTKEWIAEVEAKL